MDNHGKVKEVLFEDAVQRNSLTGEYEPSNTAFIVWANKDLKEIISKVTGVVKVQLLEYDVRYHVLIDSRYDLDFIKKEVEAEILCREV